MYIIDVDLNTFRKIRTDTASRFFYINRPNMFEIYCLFNGLMFRYMKEKTGDDNDLLWFEANLHDALQVTNMSTPDSTGLAGIYAMLNAILEEIMELRERMGKLA